MTESWGIPGGRFDFGGTLQTPKFRTNQAPHGVVAGLDERGVGGEDFASSLPRRRCRRLPRRSTVALRRLRTRRLLEQSLPHLRVSSEPGREFESGGCCFFAIFIFSKRVLGSLDVLTIYSISLGQSWPGLWPEVRVSYQMRRSVHCALLSSVNRPPKPRPSASNPFRHKIGFL